MKIETRKIRDLCIVDLEGELKYGEAVIELRRISRELIGDGEKWFVLNMEKTPWLDSCGIGEVVGFHKRAREQRGVVKLVLIDRTRSQFTMCQLQKMFDIFDNLDDATASFDEPDGRFREKF